MIAIYIKKTICNSSTMARVQSESRRGANRIRAPLLLAPLQDSVEVQVE